MKVGTYYNENDPYAVEWLRNLITAGHLPPGDVDDRSIEDVSADDLKGYEQCHFFAGIGGWPYALELAGWEGPVWTGSCPCQPLSIAGRRQGEADARHLWPVWGRLIEECRPATIFGEQVASADGREWFSAVRLDLEEMGYGVGGADLCAASVGAPHVRQRLWFVGHSTGKGLEGLEHKGANQGERREGLAKRRDDGVHEWLPSERIASDYLWPDGLPRPVGVVRGFGNAIVPQVAAVFIRAFLETAPDHAAAAGGNSPTPRA